MGQAQNGASLQSKVAFLSRPEAYRENTRTVEARETHMSWVFLTERHVYKLKKPIRARALDFSTRSAREYYCREEVRLNRRLARSVYLGVVPLVRTSAGALDLGGCGEVEDWLVHMRRLPAALMMSALIEAGRIRPGHAAAAAETLAAFYADASPVAIAPADYVARFEEEVAETLRVFGEGRAPRLREQAAGIGGRLGAFMAAGRPMLEARARERRVVEGHGDLRPEHVCLEEPPVIIDCLEFNRRLRLLEAVDELAFLGMECARLGAPWIEAVLFDACARRIPSWNAPPILVAFYKSVHALTRARLALLHLDDVEVSMTEKWMRQTQVCLAAADATAKDLGP